MRNSERKRLRNRGIRNSLRTFIKSFLLFISSEEARNKQELEKRFQFVQSKIAKAGSSNVIKAGTVARKISRLAKKVKELSV